MAAIKAPDLVTALTKAGYEVRVVATENALRFISPSDIPVLVYRDKDEWSSWTVRGDPVLHIEVSVCIPTNPSLMNLFPSPPQLSNWAHVLLLAPLSANSLAKIANGLADNLLTTLVRSWCFPVGRAAKAVYFAPAMNTRMWQHPFTEEHVTRLTDRLGWILIPPVEKTLMCGEHGVGAMAEVSSIVDLLDVGAAADGGQSGSHANVST